MYAVHVLIIMNGYNDVANWYIAKDTQGKVCTECYPGRD